MILVALGANLPSRYGDPLKSLYAAVTALSERPDIDVLAQSPVYVSAPVPVSDQPWYHNAVISIETSLKPLELLGVLHDIEEDFGRVRSIRNEARALDLDIVAYNNEIIDESGLVIPHPRIAERAFVVLPLYDLEPKWIHPLTGACVADMVEALPQGQDIQKIEGDESDAA